MTGTDTLTRHAPRPPVDPTGLAAARAATFARLDAADTPARPSRHHPVRWGLAAASAAALTVAGLTLPSPGDQPAFAGWTAVPTPLTGDALAARGSECEAAASSHGMPAADGATPLLAEERGPHTFTVIASDAWVRYCFTGPGFSFVDGHSTDGGTAYAGAGSLAVDGERVSVISSDAFAAPSAGGLTVAVSGIYTVADERWSMALGRVAPDVGAVEVTLADGTTVEATAASGTWAAWWPGTAEPREVVGTLTGGGTVRVEPEATVSRVPDPGATP